MDHGGVQQLLGHGSSRFLFMELPGRDLIMDKCKICGFEGKLNDGKCGFCQRDKGIPRGNRIKQAIKELPEEWFTITTATTILPYYFSYTVKILKKMEMIEFIETRDDSPKLYKLTKKALKYLNLKIKHEKEDVTVNEGLRRKQNKFNSEEWKDKIEEIVEKTPGCSINEVKVEGLGKKQIYAYLKELVENGVLYTEINPTDKRKKIYYHSDFKMAENSSNTTPEGPFKEKDDKIISQPGSVKVEMVNDTTPTIGQLLDKVWPHCKNATPRKPTNLKNQGFEALVAQFSDQKSLLNVFNDLPEPLQDNTQITLDPQNGKNQLIIPIIGAEL